MTDDWTLADFEFDLPVAQVAQTPTADRTAARLLQVHRGDPTTHAHGVMADLADLLRGDELIVLNDTQVVPARLRGHKGTGGRAELLVLGPGDASGTAHAMARSAKPLRPGATLRIDDAVLDVLARTKPGHYLVRLPPGFREPGGCWAFLERYGETPLPPYIGRPEGLEATDRDRYQTVFARAPGAVAAPTAGLHFTDALLGELTARGCDVATVTLHVGPGTFQPVRAARIADHVMHSERFEISASAAAQIQAAREAGRPVLAVGTTVVRTLEASAQAHGGTVTPGAGETDIFIRPGHRFQVVDQLMTNFHLPGSTLLMLVSAFCGHETMHAAYRVAIASGYRFYSYGDGMLIR